MPLPIVSALPVLALFGPLPMPLAAARAAAAAPMRPITHVETEAPALAITFDACATRTNGYGFDRAVFELVRRERLPVTIFVSGRWVETHEDAMQELAREPLVEFGDHSYDHPHMTQLSPEKILDEIDRTEAALAVYGKRSVAFRPPFGSWSRRVLDLVQARQLPTVTWDVVSGDPSLRTTAAGMIKTVVGRARPGSIVIFHINGRGWKTAEALPEIVRGLRDRGFRFVSLSELLAARGAGGGPSPEPSPSPSRPPEPPTLVTLPEVQALSRALDLAAVRAPEPIGSMVAPIEPLLPARSPSLSPSLSRSPSPSLSPSLPAPGPSP